MAPLKILMLHGYTQNGPLFHAKTRVLEKHIQKAFPGTTFSYPTGPLGLKPSDIPGFDPTTVSGSEEIEAYGWWRRSNTSDPPEYVGMDSGLQTVADVMSSEGPFDGVIGFSQGAALACMIASLLEVSRRESFARAQTKSPLAIQYPYTFDKLQHPAFKFCIPYCGFVAPGERYTAFYNPIIKTKSCHFIGSLDSVVEESRTQALIDACGGDGKVQIVTHPGGHFVPSGKQYLDAVAHFIKSATSPETKKASVEEEKVEDMDMPF